MEKKIHMLYCAIYNSQMVMTKCPLVYLNDKNVLIYQCPLIWQRMSE